MYIPENYKWYVASYISLKNCSEGPNNKFFLNLFIQIQEKFT